MPCALRCDDRPVTERRPLAAIHGFRAARAAAAIVRADGSVIHEGPLDERFAWASVTKLVTAYAVLIAADRGDLALDEPAGPPGATVRHLLAHASGLAFEGTVPVSPPERTRMYSNSGFDLLAALVEERAGRPFPAVVADDVLGPLGMSGAKLVERASQGLSGTLADLVAFARELHRPTLLPPAVLAEATSVAYPSLAGVLPGVGRFDPLSWGLGFEVRGTKEPHWTGRRNSPATVGHFGGSGTFLWVDPEAGVALACLTDREFGPWALEAWRAFSDEVLAGVGT
jgi:CubicO group peptidase (beta-lactamase class C family)